MPSVTDEIRDNIGPWLLFSYLNTILFGILCLQCYMFFQSSTTNTRRPVVKYSIVLLVVMNTVHLVFSIHESYWLMVLNFGNVEEILLHAPWSGPGLLGISAISNFVVQCWFTWRVYMLSSRNRLVIAPLVVLVTLTAGFGVALAAGLAIQPDNASYYKINWILYTYNGLDITSNLLLTVALCVFFSRFRATPVRRTKSLIDALIVYTVNTGLLSLCISTCSLILRIALPNSLVFASDYILYSELYANALLASFNARDWLWFKNEDAVVHSIPLSGLKFSPGSSANATDVEATSGSSFTKPSVTREQDDVAVEVGQDDDAVKAVSL